METPTEIEDTCTDENTNTSHSHHDQTHPHVPGQIDEDILHSADTGPALSHGHDDACDTPPGDFDPRDTLACLQEAVSCLELITKGRQHGAAMQSTSSHAKSEIHRPLSRIDAESLSTAVDRDEPFLNIPMPSTTSGPTTLAYESALANRIKAQKLNRGDEYDKRAYTPTFIHDNLMIPGTLANLIGKQSPDVIHRMTPALLPGFHPHVHSTTHQPCLLQSPSDASYVQGIVIFGQGRAVRDKIHAHYRPHCRRIKVEVEVELLCPKFDRSGWERRRKRIWANAWLWADSGSADVMVQGKWTLEGYLTGEFEVMRGLRIGYDGFIGEDYDEGGDSGEEDVEGGKGKIPSDDLAVKSPKAKREHVWSGAGNIDYERSPAAVGWW